MILPGENRRPQARQQEANEGPWREIGPDPIYISEDEIIIIESDTDDDTDDEEDWTEEQLRLAEIHGHRPSSMDHVDGIKIQQTTRKRTRDHLYHTGRTTINNARA